MLPLTTEKQIESALKHHQAGRLQQAELLYRQVLARQPEHAIALHYLGVIAHQMGQHDIAVELIRRAIALNPNYAEAHNNLGNALKHTGQLPEAIASFRRAIALNPNVSSAHVNLGIALNENGQIDEAIGAYRRAIALNPGLAEVHSNLGNALKKQGLPDEAIAAHRQAIALKPELPGPYNNLGNVLKDLKQLDEAIAVLRRAVALDPTFAEAYANLGNVLREKGLLDDAIAAFRQAIALRPAAAEPYNDLANALKDSGRLDEAVAAYRQAIALRPDFIDAHSNLVYTLYFHPAYDAWAIAGEHREWEMRHAEPLKQYIKPHANDRSPERRLRIGYLSPDFCQHPVGRFLLPLLAHHDHQSFEIFAYANAPARAPIVDPMTERLRSHTDAWRFIEDLSDAEAADLIRQDHIDILVDLTLHMAHNRLLIFARKPAPVQVTYLAYAGTSGLSTMDYRLSDPYLDPLDDARDRPFDPAQGGPAGGDESIYTEQTVRLPETYWRYLPVDFPQRPPPALEKGRITFGSLNNFCKVNDPLLSLWARLLMAVPRSRLVLHAQQGSHRHRVLEYVRREGVDPDRVSFVGTVPAGTYLESYHSIDIALDTAPYGGGTTTCDALWMGVPVVSLVGTRAVGRGGLSILSNIGLPDLVAHTPDEYVRIAARLANDVPRLAELRSTLRQRMEASPLMDAPKFAWNIEAAYRRMWRNWCESQE